MSAAGQMVCDIASPNLTFKQAMAAYDGMVATDLIRVVRGGFYDCDTGMSDVQSDVQI